MHEKKITYLQNEQITSHPPYYASYENRKKEKNSYNNTHIGLTGCCILKSFNHM